MAKVVVRYFGILRELVGKRDEKLTIEDSASINELIESVSKIHGDKFSEYVFDSNGRLRKGFVYAINGDTVSEGRLANIKCKEVSEFAILPPISGGSTIYTRFSIRLELQ